MYRFVAVTMAVAPCPVLKATIRTNKISRLAKKIEKRLLL